LAGWRRLAVEELWKALWKEEAAQLSAASNDTSLQHLPCLATLALPCLSSSRRQPVVSAAHAVG